MNPEVERLFESASSLAPDQRSAYLRGQTQDEAVRREVLSLLAHDALAEPFFAGAIGSAASSLEREQELSPGTRIGVYAITRILGRGGMGEVYLATRVDGSFEQTVAIKVTLSATAGGGHFLLQRFQHERQILARLNHPNIARLLDGGETETGAPYFVLEYVPGEDIVGYCERRRLGIRERLRLSLQVCGAVQYAHENLVVHRDLKPGNILVDKDGNAKLLDFGIAKVLDPAQTGGAMSTRVLTPDYASPEQVRGDPITTASDVYSLGAVLYSLLTGAPPHSVASLSPLEAARTISEQPAPAAVGVPADLAAILSKAVHPDPVRRYRSASELSSDIERFLDGKPVIAAPDSAGYRAGKFLRRHWVGASAAVAIVLTLAAGATATVWEARRAARRFAEVRQLSNRFLFDFEAALHDVAGATKARQLVVKTAQEYLDRLAADARGDRSLVHELAGSYQKLADVQGSTVEGNTGDTKAALAGYRHALALRDSIDERHATNITTRIAYLENLIRLVRAEQQTGDTARAVPLGERAVVAAREWMSTSAQDPAFLSAAASTYAILARAQADKGNYPTAVANANESLRLEQMAMSLNPTDSKRLHNVAAAYFVVGNFEKSAGHASLAVANFSMAENLFQKLAQSGPPDVTARRSLLMASWYLAQSTLDMRQEQKQKDFAGPLLPSFARVYQTANDLLRDDPASALAQNDLASVALAYGAALEQAGRPGESVSILGTAIERQTGRLAAAPHDRTIAYNLALLHQWAADSYRDRQDLARALKHRGAAEELLDLLVATGPGVHRYSFQKAENLHRTGDLLAAIHDYAGARECYAKGLAIAEKMPSGPALLDANDLIAKLHASRARIAEK